MSSQWARDTGRAVGVVAVAPVAMILGLVVFALGGAGNGVSSLDQIIEGPLVPFEDSMAAPSPATDVPLVGESSPAADSSIGEGVSGRQGPPPPASAPQGSGAPATSPTTPAPSAPPASPPPATSPNVTVPPTTAPGVVGNVVRGVGETLGNLGETVGGLVGTVRNVGQQLPLGGGGSGISS